MTGLVSPGPALELVASYGTPQISGRSDDPSWSRARSYSLAAMMGPDGHRKPLAEPGSIRLLWDEGSLYLCAEFTDTDVVTEAERDGLHAYEFGDVCEFFLRPADALCYWEFYATPRGHQTTFAWPSGGRRLPSALQTVNRLTVAAYVRGTLNDHSTRDSGWSAEMAIPWEILRRNAISYGPADSWRVLVGRYNYGASLPSVELSSAPAIPDTDFHDIAQYASLRLERPR